MEEEKEEEELWHDMVEYLFGSDQIQAMEAITEICNILILQSTAQHTFMSLVTEYCNIYICIHMNSIESIPRFSLSSIESVL